MGKLKLMILLLCTLSSMGIVADEARLGEEFIKPLEFPKFSLTGDYSIKRNFLGFADTSLRIALANRFSGAMSFEAGILKYMNAGGEFAMSFSDIEAKKEPMDFRFGLFVKPFVSVLDRIAFFSRLRGGIAVARVVDTSALDYYRNVDESDNLDAVYHGQEYLGWPFGGFAALSLGVEVFPFSRVGIAVEGGIRASIFRNHRNIPFSDKKANSIAGAPNAFNFMVYEWPLSVTLHAIF